MISRFFDWFLYFFLFIAVVSSRDNKYCQLQCFGNVTNTVCDRADQKCGPNPECGEDFRVIELDDDDRQYILDIHNYLRNKVALGHEKRGRQPPAANMMAMSYDRELEFMAQCWANACKGNPLLHDICRRTCEYDHIGQNLGSISSTSPSIDLVKSLKELILGWYDEVGDYNSTWIADTKPSSCGSYRKDIGTNVLGVLDDDMRCDLNKSIVDRILLLNSRFARLYQLLKLLLQDKETGHYTQLVWANTNTIGCAVSYYSMLSQDQKWYVLLLVCDYGPGGNYLGSPVYQVGKPCTCCPTAGMLKNKVYKGLCGMDRRLKETDQYQADVF